jgi:hypothetical protein
MISIHQKVEIEEEGGMEGAHNLALSYSVRAEAKDLFAEVEGCLVRTPFATSGSR